VKAGVVRAGVVKLPWLALAALLANPVQAAPMGFKDSVMAMGDLSRNWQELLVNYALTARDAVGASVLHMRSDDGVRRRDVLEATYTRLLQRWNLPEAQGNIWFIGGAGVIEGNNFSGSKTLSSPGAQVDYETTRVYFSAFARLYRATAVRHDFIALRSGFSFYEADYDETQPWLVLEARRMKGLSEKTEITPMLRLIHKRYFVELGVNRSRQARANFMVIF
jgi:hypothetical protein